MFKKKFKDYKEKKGLVMEQKTFTAGSPKREVVEKRSELLDYKAFRDLQFKGSIEVKADPNVEAAKGSYPYAILNNTNRVLEAKYPGYDNISGNAIVRLQNSQKSQFLNLYDSVMMVKRLNYLYLAYEDGGTEATRSENIAVNIEMVKAVEQALSYGYSTMLTQLAFYTDKSTTDLPRIGSLVGHSNDTYDKMGAVLHYQTVLQNLISPLAKYTELRSMEEHLMNISYRREAPIIQQVFGQLKKKAFIAQMNAIGSNIIGEYFDVNWYKQANALRHIPSRKANDMNNPLITMVTTHKIPRLQLWADEAGTGTAYYDSNSALVYASADLLDPEDFVKKTMNNITLENIVLNVSKLLDAHYLLTWARKFNNNLLDQNAIKSSSAYYQSIVDYINTLSIIASRFSTNMTEIRTFLDKLSDTNMVYWKKGISFNIERIEEVPLTYNQVIADVLKSTLSGAYEVKYDIQTLRWNCDTEWNMYTGINEYDKKSGGSFLTFGTRNINLDAFRDSSNVVDYTDTALLIPIAFDKIPVVANTTPATGYFNVGVYALNRLGDRQELFSHQITNNDLKSSKTLSRLNPIITDDLSVKAPSWKWTNVSGSTDEKARLASAMHKLLVQTAGYDHLAISGSAAECMCNDDLLSFVDLQIEDVSNAMIQFCRNYSPFRVSTPDGERTIGFGKM